MASPLNAFGFVPSARFTTRRWVGTKPTTDRALGNQQLPVAWLADAGPVRAIRRRGGLRGNLRHRFRQGEERRLGPRPGNPMQYAAGTLRPTQRVARAAEAGRDTAGNLTRGMRVIGIDDADAAVTGIERVRWFHG
ncbi:hypothetical protein [Hymenobacter volaticus]|uniref:Uncharacterized protein n=1 Tax=Hymenobacter volaticus TaxID=2932254 RepID=A0ABY4GF21_9BACT|nr:hypothetical protein [Hymenobacter volaticus]UOQ69525.1 hypothetical protein MUN86_28200 [Hymenobacter volaticus]